MPARRSSEAVWGEGWADDDWTSMARLDRWDLVHADEVLRFFPGLTTTPADAGLLHDLLEQAVGVSRQTCAEDGRDARQTAWFRSSRPLWSALNRLLGDRPHIVGAGREPAILALEALLGDRRAGRATPYTEHLAFTLAFYACIHPAYFWQEALPLDESATAIGWLGMVARGRPALLPRDIAATLADSIGEAADGSDRPRDQRFSLCRFTPTQWSMIGRAARRCLSGQRDVVRLKADTRFARTPVRHTPVVTSGAAHRHGLGMVTARHAKQRAS